LSYEERGAKRLKKLIIPLLLIMILAFVAIPLNAAPELVILMKDDSAVSGITATQMPFMSGGEMYIPHDFLNGFAGLKTFYNASLGQLMVYDFESRITFDLKNDITFDDNGILIPEEGISKNGLIFVPVKLLSERFGFYYSLVTNYKWGIVVRICSYQPDTSDQIAISNNSARIKVIYNQYNAAYSTTTTRASSHTVTQPASSTEAPSSTVTTTTTTAPKLPVDAGIMITGAIGPEYSSMLDLLSEKGISAAVFFTAEDILEYPELVIRTFCEGHSVGLSLSRYSCLDDASKANEALFRLLRIRSRLVCIEGGIGSAPMGTADSLKENGYILWEPEYDTSAGEGLSAGVMAVQIFSDTEGRTVLRFEPGAHRSVRYMLEFGISGLDFFEIREWTEPVI